MSRVEELGWEDVPVPAAPPVGLPGAATLKDAGNAQFKDGKYDDAIASYTQALALICVKPVPVVKRMAADMPKKEEEAVVEDIVVVPEPTPEEATLASQLFSNSAMCWMKKSDSTRAIPLLTRAIQHDEKYAKAIYRRGECYLATENYSSAHTDFTKAKELGFRDAELESNLQTSKVKMEEQTAKALGDLKALGNTLLGKFGMSLDNFKMEKDPNSGGYSINFQK